MIGHLSLIVLLGAAPPLELHRLLDEVGEAAPAVSTQRAQVDAAEAGIGVAGAWEDPQLGVMAENLPLNLMIMDDDPMAPMVTYRVMQPLNLFGRRRLAKDAASARANVERERLKRAQWDARAQAVMSFYELWMNEQMEALLDRQIALMTQMKDAAKARYVAGMMMGHHDMLRATAEVATMSAERASLADERLSAAAMINTLRRHPVNEELGAAVLPVHKPLPELQSLRSLTRARPEVAAARHMQAEMEAERGSAERMYLPMVMVEGFYQQRLTSQPDMFGAALNFTLPLWWFDRQSHEVEMAEAMVRRAERDVEAMEAMTESDLVSAYSKAKAAERVLAALDGAALPALRETVDSDRAAYVAGTGTFIDLLETLSALREAEMKRISAVMRMQTTRFELQRLLAAPLESTP